LSALVEIAVLTRVAEIFASLRDADQALAKFLELARDVAASPLGAIYLRDDARGRFERWREGADTPSAPLPTALVDAVFAGAEHVWVALDEPRFDGVPAFQLARAGGVHAALGLALRHRGALVGVLGLGFAETGPLDEQRLRTLTAIAGFPAAAIEHARASELSERRARLAQVLREFGERALTTIEVEGIHQLILETVVALTRSDQASITELERGRVRVIAGVGKDAALVGTRAPVELFGAALDAREPFVVGDTAAAPESLLVTLARKQGAQSFMVIAMRHQDRVIGHLFAGAPETHRYRAEELEAMRILASMAAAVIVERRARAAAEHQARTLESTIEHLPILVEVYGAGGELERANAAARALRERLAAPAGGRTLFAARRVCELDGAPADPETLPLARALAGEHPPPREVAILGDEGARLATLLIAAAPVRARSGQVESVVVACQDVSRLHELAEAKDLFLRVASHELRTPVTALRATTQLFDIDPSVMGDAERRDAALARLHRQSTRLVRLVEQLLDSARLSAGELPIAPREIDLAALCREALDELALAGGTRATLEAPAPVIGRWDPLRLEQVVTNLVSNAIRYSPDGAQVVVSVSAADGHARIAVRDRGIGIPAGELAQLFAPFFRGARAHARHAGGLGLGLHIAQAIVRRHGGRIHVESREGEGGGTTFTVELPLG
jgi:signal transduction histidine kinase